MARSNVLDAVADARRVTILHEEDGKHYIESRQDVSHIIDAACALADEVPGKDFRHAAFIPDYVWNQAATEGWLNDTKAWKRWANDPANACFRTWKGRL